MAKAAKANNGAAPAPAGKAKGGKGGKAAKPRSAFADFMTLVIAVACTVWAFKTIIGLSGQGF